MPKAFISYARDASHGEHLAAEVQQQLLAAGYEVFRDVIGLKPGDVWYHKLEFELDSSDVMVLVVSEKVRTSKWVHNEVSMAEEIGIPVIPLLAERVRYPLWLRHLQVLDFCGVRDWALLMGAVAHQLGMPIVKTKPVWASAAGDDNFGSWADLDMGGVIQRFRWIKPGTFWMGSPDNESGRRDDETRHQVTLTQGYWLADTACTQALWQQVMGNNPARFQDSLEHPVEQVSWDDTQQFIQAANRQVSGLKLCLPTEAQWEYACRAGTTTPFSFGETITPTQVNYDGHYPYANAEKGEYRGRTVAVKSLAASPWGLYQMHGNVWEWCQDEYGEYPKNSATDPVGSDSSGLRVVRVVRGGSWGDDGRYCRSANRHRFTPYERDGELGCRLVLRSAELK